MLAAIGASDYMDSWRKGYEVLQLTKLKLSGELTSSSERWQNDIRRLAQQCESPGNVRGITGGVTPIVHLRYDGRLQFY